MVNATSRPSCTKQYRVTVTVGNSCPRESRPLAGISCSSPARQPGFAFINRWAPPCDEALDREARWAVHVLVAGPAAQLRPAEPCE
ncbi:hypothetical protein BHM03_00030098 [Ensete ventricosum]|nr:hypothetical protein BHM03_00030098 [Ensete ventricosum]